MNDFIKNILSLITLDTSKLEVKADDLSRSVVALPETHKLIDMEQYMINPLRIKEDIEVNSIESFVKYLKKFKTETTIVFGHPQILTSSSSFIFLKANIDYHVKGEPSWNTHSLKLKLTKTPEMQTWEKHQGNPFSQREFLRFIKDNATVIAEPALADFIKAVSDVKVTGGFSASSKTEGHNAASEAKANIEFGNVPETFKILLKPYFMTDDYGFRVNLYVNKTPDDGLFFSYKIANLEASLLSQFKEYTDKVEKDLGIEVII